MKNRKAKILLTCRDDTDIPANFCLGNRENN